MKLTKYLTLASLNGYVILLFLVMILTLPIQFLDFSLRKKNALGRPLENVIFKTLFRITDVRKNM